MKSGLPGTSVNSMEKAKVQKNNLKPSDGVERMLLLGNYFTVITPVIIMRLRVTTGKENMHKNGRIWTDSRSNLAAVGHVACLIKVHFNEKSFGVDEKWLLKTDAHLIQVAIWAGWTVMSITCIFLVPPTSDMPEPSMQHCQSIL